MKHPTTIYVVDDDARVLKALGHLLRAAHFAVQAYESAALFLRHYNPALPSCVICDLAMPRCDGLALQRALIARGGHSPVIFLSGHDSVPGSVQAMKQGAVDFLIKPVSEKQLLKSIDNALKREVELRDARSRVSLLTLREKQVLQHIIDGRLSKQIADDCGVSLRTVKFHRANLVRKLRVSSTAEMIRLGIKSGRFSFGASAGKSANPGAK